MWLGILTSVGSVCAEEEGKSCSQEDGVAWETFDHSPQHDTKVLTVLSFVTVFVQCLETVFLSVKVHICSAKAVIFHAARKESDEEARSNLVDRPTQLICISDIYLLSWINIIFNIVRSILSSIFSDQYYLQYSPINIIFQYCLINIIFESCQTTPLSQMALLNPSHKRRDQRLPAQSCFHRFEIGYFLTIFGKNFVIYQIFCNFKKLPDLLHVFEICKTIYEYLSKLWNLVQVVKFSWDCEI